MSSKLFFRVSLPVLVMALAGLFPKKGSAQTIRPSTQKEIKIYDPNSSGTGNISLRAAAGTASYTLTFPGAMPALNQVLGVSSSSGGVGTLTWTTVSLSAVSTFSGGTTGLTPATATSGAVTLGGTLVVANGGTGVTNSTGSGSVVLSNSPVLVAPTVSSLTVASGGTTITAGGLTVTAGGANVAGNITVNPTGGVAGQLRLRNPANTFQTNIQAGAQTADITYILPTIAPTAGQFLSSSDANGNLSWTSGSAGWGLSGNAITASTAALGVAPTGGSWLGTTNSQSLVFGTNNVTRVIIASDGSVTSNGNITAPAFFETSDQRLKNIVKRDGDVVYFKWKDGRDSKIHIGYLAQEVQQKMPDQVKADDKGILSVNYIEVLVNKIRDLEKRVEELEKFRKNEKE